MRRWRSGSAPMRFAPVGRARAAATGRSGAAVTGNLVAVSGVRTNSARQPRALAENWQRLHFYESLFAAVGMIRKPVLLYLDDMQCCDSDSI